MADRDASARRRRAHRWAAGGRGTARYAVDRRLRDGANRHRRDSRDVLRDGAGRLPRNEADRADRVLARESGSVIDIPAERACRPARDGRRGAGRHGDRARHHLEQNSEKSEAEAPAAGHPLVGAAHGGRLARRCRCDQPMRLTAACSGFAEEERADDDARPSRWRFPRQELCRVGCRCPTVYVVGHGPVLARGPDRNVMGR